MAWKISVGERKMAVPTTMPTMMLMASHSPSRPDATPARVNVLEVAGTPIAGGMEPELCILGLNGSIHPLLIPHTVDAHGWQSRPKDRRIGKFTDVLHPWVGFFIRGR
jgi:hypothetical protein